jgi:hypothetical protein
MTLYKHELKMNHVSFIVWLTGVLAMSAGCIFLFPLIDDSMADMSEAFASMGGFSAAFGMDKLAITTLEGFFGTEIGTIFGLGSGMYAALLGISALSKEETNHTAEFLHTLTIGRCGILTGKLGAIFTLLALFDAAALGVFKGSAAIIGESLSMKCLLGYIAAQLAAQVEIASVCFALSAFSKRSGMGMGLGIALVLYVLDIAARIAEEADFLKYITPFSYSNATDVFVNKGSIEAVPLCIGAGITLAGLAAAYIVYRKRDIAA